MIIIPCFQMLFLLAGIYALVKGKLPLLGNMVLEGKTARIVGIVLIVMAIGASAATSGSR